MADDLEALKPSKVVSDLRCRLEEKLARCKPGSREHAFAQMRLNERITRTNRLVGLLENDTSEYAIHFDDPDEMRQAAADFVVALDEVNADGTTATEAYHCHA
eukprot:4081733-Prymnesium_polylepis.1